jgi:NAD(P)-dependent dehydrogenase (short-subunit alcohol dehydrogenase family)
MMGLLDGKVAIVTGATVGIGRATAILLATEGARVIATGRREEEGAETQRLIEEAGGTGLFIKQDVAVEDDWRNLVLKTIEAYGRIDVLVNNAGTFFVKPIEETELEEMQFLQQVNVEGMFLGAKYCLEEMKKAGGGSIINVSSLMGQMGLPNGTAYCASKGAATHLSKALAVEFAPYNIRVNSLHPGVIDTEMIEGFTGGLTAMIQLLIDETPLKVLGQPEDIANNILFLASDESRYITGTEITIDGGRLAGQIPNIPEEVLAQLGAI